MQTPVSVTVTNLTGITKTLYWLPKGIGTLRPYGRMSLDFEPWSAASRNQRASMLAALSNKSIKLTLHVMGADGEMVNIDYDPSLTLGLRKASAPAPAAPVKTASGNLAASAMAGGSNTVQIASPANTELSFDGANHTVIASGAGSAATVFGFTSEAVKPPVAVQPLEAPMGFTKTAVSAAGTSTGSAPEKKAKEAEAPAPAETSVSVKERFNALTAEKKWDEALQLLVDTFGTERIAGITKRSLMSLKDYDAVVAKHGLA